MEGEPDSYAPVQQALRLDSPTWLVYHVDITCDGCDCEPIVGSRYKCTVCDDIDLCGRCMRALVAARLKMAAEAGGLRPAKQQAQQSRPRRWVAKLHSRDTRERWAALLQAVPCLHPSHKFSKVVDGPERAVVFVGSSATAVAAATEMGPAGPQQAQRGAPTTCALGEAGQPSGDSRAHCGATEPGSVAAAAGSQQQPAAAAEELAAAVGELAVRSCSAAAEGSSGAEPSSSQPGQGGTPGSAAPQQRGGESSNVGPRPAAAGYEAQLAEFLRTFPPSQASCRDLAWVVAQRPGEAPPESSGNVEDRVEEALEEWEQLTAPGRPPPTASDIDALARRHSLLAGKWMAFPQSSEADAAWAAVARAVVLGGLACQAKVSSVDPSKPDHVICVYTDDYQDLADVGRVREGLRAALAGPLCSRRRLLYKPDVYTYLGIYSGNEWNLRPTVYNASL